jgi:tripartite-type tricarboxylate transporter receptor subunit TctC
LKRTDEQEAYMLSVVCRSVLAALALGIPLTAGTAAAQGIARASVAAYPTKPVRMIVPLAPGGGSDIVGRIVAVALAERWQQPVIVDNRPGAGSRVGTALAAKAASDGYTLLVSSSSMAITPALYRNLDFDVRRDFAGVTLIASQPSILAVHPSVPVKSVKELVSLAKVQAGKLAYGSAGPGSATHLGAELLKHAAGINILHVPYKSAGQATSALLSGETQILLTNMASLLPHVKSGRINALGVSSRSRSPLAPELPTLAESGLAGFEYATWYGMLAPAGTAREVVNLVQANTAALINTPQTRQRFTGQGLEVHGTPPAEFEGFLAAEIAKWGSLVRAVGVRVE